MSSVCSPMSSRHGRSFSHLERRTAEVPDLTAIHTPPAHEAAPPPEAVPPPDESTLATLRREHRAAVDLLAIVGALGWSGHVVEAAELQPYALLFGPDRRALDSFVQTIVGPLLDTGDLPLLEAYFRSGRNLRATAEATRFHVNTITQRLRRVDGLLGPSWRSPDRAFLTEAAVRLVSLDSQAWIPWVRSTYSWVWSARSPADRWYQLSDLDCSSLLGARVPSRISLVRTFELSASRGLVSSPSTWRGVSHHSKALQRTSSEPCPPFRRRRLARMTMSSTSPAETSNWKEWVVGTTCGQRNIACTAIVHIRR